MKAFIFLAHGSRRQQSNDEVRHMVGTVSSALGSCYDWSSEAFLEIETPSLPQAIESALSQGASSITIYPFFLNSGNHVERDIPGIVNTFEIANPACQFVLLDHFGSSGELPALIIRQVTRSAE